MPLLVTLTVVPKEQKEEFQQSLNFMMEESKLKTKAKKKASSTTTTNKQEPTPQKGLGEGFSDEPATATPRHAVDVPPQPYIEEAGRENANNNPNDDETELDLKDLEIERPTKNSTRGGGGGSSSGSLSFLWGSSSTRRFVTHDPEEDEIFAMALVSTGKYSRKATLQDIALFTGIDTVDSDLLKNWLHVYLKQNFPNQLLKPNCTPRSAHIQDDVKKGFQAFEPYGWQVVKLNIQPGLIDVKEQGTQEVTLEQFQLNYETDIEKALIEKGDMEVVSYLKKGPMRGHPLAVNVFQKSKKLQEDSQLLTEFRGVDSVVFRLGNNECKAEHDESTGELIWKDTKILRALLHGKPLPRKTGKGVSRTVSVLALESHLRARVYYKASFSGSISTDHGNEQFDGRRYWNWELKYLLRYNGIPNVQVMYQDIEVKFYSRIQYAMDNEEWEWVNKGGSWVKQKPSGRNEDEE